MVSLDLGSRHQTPSEFLQSLSPFTLDIQVLFVSKMAGNGRHDCSFLAIRSLYKRVRIPQGGGWGIASSLWPCTRREHRPAHLCV